MTASDLPTADFNLNFSLSYQQAEPNAVTLTHPICKRSTVFHTEICNNVDNNYPTYYCSGSGYKIGEFITYGNLGTTGTLTSWDAFDCDVNGDGVYDSETERFYYVSGKDGDDTSDYATLIYYNNVSNGVSDNTKNYAWALKDDYIATGGTESDYETAGNYNKGPVTAIKQIPTRTQWKNVKLSNTIRNITDEKKTVRVNNFSYSGYAARLLTSQEVNKECEITVGDVNKGELSSKCEYLMENTKYSTSSNTSYGPWLENVHNLISKRSWYIVSNNCLVNNNMFHV